MHSNFRCMPIERLFLRSVIYLIYFWASLLFAKETMFWIFDCFYRKKAQNKNKVQTRSSLGRRPCSGASWGCQASWGTSKPTGLDLGNLRASPFSKFSPAGVEKIKIFAKKTILSFFLQRRLGQERFEMATKDMAGIADPGDYSQHNGCSLFHCNSIIFMYT